MSAQTRAALGLPPSVHPRPELSTPAPTAAHESFAELTVTLRVQRRLALRTMALLLGGLILLPVLLDADWLGRVHVLGVPVVWLVLGAWRRYPLLLLGAHRHRRAVDRLETALAARHIGPAH